MNIYERSYFKRDFMEQRPKNIDFFTSRHDMDSIFGMSNLLG